MVASALPDTRGKIGSSASPRPSEALEVLGVLTGAPSLLRKMAGAGAGTAGRSNRGGRGFLVVTQDLRQGEQSDDNKHRREQRDHIARQRDWLSLRLRNA